MAMSGSGTGALKQLRHGGNSFAYPSAQTAKDFLKKKSFGGDKAAGTFPRAVQHLVNKYPEVVAQIRKLVEKEKNALGKWTNKEPEARQTILIEKPKPLKNS